MKTKSLTVAVFVSLALCCAYVGAQNSQQQYDNLLKEFTKERTRDWHLRSPALISLAESVLASATNLDMQLTAKLVLAQVLVRWGYCEVEPDKIERACQLWAEIIKDGTGTWQSAIAQLSVIFELGGQGKQIEQITQVKNALAHFNFDILEQCQDPALKVLCPSQGEKPDFYREALKLAWVNALCDLRRISEAKEVYPTIKDPEFAVSMRERIELGEEMMNRGWATQKVLKASVRLEPEVLKVSPGILTAFVRLPEGYPVKYITSARCDSAFYERMMLNDDETEMIIKFHRKDIEAALARMGKSIDTNFVVRGIWRGATGTNSFEGLGSIQKIVGAEGKKK